MVSQVGISSESAWQPVSGQTIPVYVINLNRRTDRWKAISSNLDRIGVMAERIPAIEATSLAAQDEWEKEHGNARDYRINYGSAANIMGHKAAMTRLLASPHAPAALVLEDDAELAPEAAALLRSVDWWPKGALAVRLEEGDRGHKPRLLWRSSGKTPNGQDLCRFERRMPGSAAYLINRRGAEIVLASFQDAVLTTDQILFNMLTSPAARRLGAVQVIPPLARQRPEAGSDQVKWREREQATIGFPERYRRFLRRNVWSLRFRLRLWFLMMFGIVRRVPVIYRPEPPSEP